MRGCHYDFGADGRATVEVNHILIDHANAAGGDALANGLRKPPPDRAAEKGSVAEHFPMRKFPATRRLRGGRAVASCRQEAQSHDRTATDSAARRSGRVAPGRAAQPRPCLRRPGPRQQAGRASRTDHQVIEMWRPNTDAWAWRGHLDSVAATIIDGETASRLRQERLAGSRSREERSQRPVAGRGEGRQGTRAGLRRRD